MKKVLMCHLIENTPADTELDALLKDFIHVKTFIDESHLFRYVLKCNRCGQLYFFEFKEEIDWNKGNDPQYTTYIPVKTEEEAEELNKKSSFELLGVFPRLQADFLQDGTKTIRWNSKSTK